MIKLLYCGDLTASTGFGRVNEEILTRLPPDQWDIHVLAINATGDAHPLQKRFSIYPAASGGDSMGIGRFPELIKEQTPDIVVIHNDSWVLNHYFESLGDAPAPPIVGYSPPDAPNQYLAAKLNRLALYLSPTEFGIRELQAGGYTGPTAVLPYGVDMETFTPGNRREARLARGFDTAAKDLGIDPKLLLDGFVVGRADRNAPRKRYDLTMAYWAEWWKDAGRPDDAWLYLHCSPHDVGWDLPQLGDYFGIGARLIFTGVTLHPGKLGPIERLVNVYRSWDVHLSTAVGEGWGLVAHESAACRIPQILPHHSSLAEVWKGAAWFVPCSGVQVHNKGINTVGAVPDADGVIKALDAFYRKTASTEPFAELAYRRATESRFEWDGIAARFEGHLRDVLDSSVKKESAA